MNTWTKTLSWNCDDIWFKITSEEIRQKRPCGFFPLCFWFSCSLNKCAGTFMDILIKKGKLIKRVIKADLKWGSYFGCVVLTGKGAVCRKKKNGALILVFNFPVLHIPQTRKQARTHTHWNSWASPPSGIRRNYHTHTHNHSCGSWASHTSTDVHTDSSRGR